MSQTVSITSQGQITIPASIRRLLGLDKYPKASIRTEDNRIIVEPITDLLEMKGVLSKKALKKKSINQVIELEEKAVSQATTR